MLSLCSILSIVYMDWLVGQRVRSSVRLIAVQFYGFAGNLPS